jgi:serine/threonine protein kinase
VWAELPKLKFKIRQFSVPRGNVEFCNQIGDCVFGEVWLGSVKSQSSSASDITPCVIKLLKDRRNDGGTRTDRDIGEFLREAEIMSRFDHPNVLRLLGISITQTPYLILTEYLDKRDLKHLLQRDRQRDQLWSLKMKLNCALQVAEGLQYLTVVKS